MSAASEKSKEKSDLEMLRREGGAYLKEKREAAGISQRELASRIGIDYYTFISQLESGRGRVPADKYEKYAIAVGVPVREFAMSMMRYNDPIVYALVFPDKGPTAMADLEERLRRLEAMTAAK